MTHEQWSRIVDLWNAGKSIGEIAKRTGVPEREIGMKLLNSVERAKRVRTNAAGQKASAQHPGSGGAQSVWHGVSRAR
jgi:hypothetical protein